MKTRFEIRFTPRFLKEIEAYDREVQVRIIREINILKTTPHIGKTLHGVFKGVYSLRIGDYRVLYQIKGNEVVLLIVGHRKRVYG